jgi:protein-tyrosine phosphatase
MGNICRSPTAEGVLHAIQKRHVPDLQLSVDSAGTHARYHLGEQPDLRSQRAAKARGYDISGHRARVVTAEDFELFDYVLAMDSENLSHLKRMHPGSSRAELGLLLDFSAQSRYRSVPDPYMGGPDGFEQVLDLVEEGVCGLLRILCDRQGLEFPDSVFRNLKANARHEAGRFNR